MSALLPIATAKADSRKRSCLLPPESGQCSATAHVCFGPNSEHLRFMYGRALLARKSYSEALGELEIAAELNPNLAFVYCGLADSLAYEGRIDEAIPYFQRGIDLSPHDPLRWAFYSYRAIAHLFAREFDLAEEWARKATRVPNCHYLGFAHRVASLGHLQPADELEAALAELRQVNPDFTCKFAQRRLFYVNPWRKASARPDGAQTLR